MSRISTYEKLVAIQNRLKQVYGPDHYYTTEYHKHEMAYWGRIPEELEDSLISIDIHRPSVLDIGPGYGTLSCFAAELVGPDRVTVLDRVPYMYSHVEAAWGISSYASDIERDHIPGLFDAIVMTEVLEHFNFHPVATLKKIRRLLQPQGRIYLSTPNAETWGRVPRYKSLEDIPECPQDVSWNDPAWIDGHIWQYTQQELMSVVTTSGLQMLQLTHSTSEGGTHFNAVLGAV